MLKYKCYSIDLTYTRYSISLASLIYIDSFFEHFRINFSLLKMSGEVIIHSDFSIFNIIYISN